MDPTSCPVLKSYGVCNTVLTRTGFPIQVYCAKSCNNCNTTPSTTSTTTTSPFLCVDSPSYPCQNLAKGEQCGFNINGIYVYTYCPLR
jgi:hypothetical protein